MQLSCFMKKSVIIIGAGAAGIGIGIILKKMGLDFLIVEKNKIGQSFLSWSPKTRFLSPSFTGNFFGAPDLNSLCPQTSPAYTLQTEHPTGNEYAHYLRDLVAFYALPVLENSVVKSIEKNDSWFQLSVGKNIVTSDVVIWAGGEYQFPKVNVCEGSTHGIHTSNIKNWNDLSGDLFPIIGGYESGFDTAINLAKRGKRSVIFDAQDHINIKQSDASFSLSPFTKDRYKKYKSSIFIQPFTRIKKINNQDNEYILTSESDKKFIFHTRPILATGFVPARSLAGDLFHWKNSVPTITNFDESTRIPGIFLVGPQVQHDQMIFCFIYKFRQRFAIVAEAITRKLGKEKNSRVQKTLQNYKQNNFYLADLSGRNTECVC